MAELPNGRVLIGGDFTSVDGIDRPGMARVIADANVFVLHAATILPNRSIRLTLTTQPGKVYAFEASTDLAQWLPVRTITANGFMLEFEDAGAARFSHRFYRASVILP
ncbi:MAG: delta-60 repeat domain-containing protein [Verrucomicrobiales bacterium]|nr:delta-60 repeat domain-containing protein [Verrucomicrobiales bacterium]